VLFCLAFCGSLGFLLFTKKERPAFAGRPFARAEKLAGFKPGYLVYLITMLPPLLVTEVIVATVALDSR
jgi:hypothetical protein